MIKSKNNKTRVTRTPKARLALGVISVGLSLYPVSAYSLDVIPKINDIIDSITIAINQTAINPVQVGHARQAAAQVSANVIVANEQAIRVKKALDELSPYKGIPSSMFCKTHEEHTHIVTTDTIKNDYTSKIMLDKAATTKVSYGASEADRAETHLNNFCDMSEVARSLCPIPAAGLTGADSDYATIAGNDLLDQQSLVAARAYTKNVIDPIPLEIEGCTTRMCETSLDIHKTYQSLGSLVQNTFENQISESLIQTFENEAITGIDNNIKMDADGRILGVGSKAVPSQGGNASSASGTASTTGNASSPTATTTPSVYKTGQPTGSIVAIGDTILEGVADAHKIKDRRLGQGAATPEVLNIINNLSGGNSSYYKGKTVILSTGATYSVYKKEDIPSAMATVKAQLISLKGAKVVVLGVSNNNLVGEKSLGTALNAALQKVCKENGAKFTGGFQSKKDWLDPQDPKSINIGI